MVGGTFQNHKYPPKFLGKNQLYVIVILGVVFSISSCDVLVAKDVENVRIMTKENDESMNKSLPKAKVIEHITDTDRLGVRDSNGTTPSIIVPPVDILTPCEAKLVAFGVSVSEFMRCSVLHSRPMNLCSKCETQFRSLKEQYNFIKKVGTQFSGFQFCL